MGRFVIVAYKPKPGMEQKLREAVNDHVPILRKEGLATEHPVSVMRAEDGSIIEVFEWTSLEAVSQAHSNPEVQKLWVRFGEACDYIPLTNLAEAHNMFAGFEPLD